MNWMDALLRFFRPAPSGAVAKERLRLVLLSDRINLAPEVVDQLRGDLIATISRYMEIDEIGLDVTFETRENDVALLANIPIKGVRARPLPPPMPAAPPAPSDAATGAVDLAEAAEEPASEHASEPAAPRKRRTKSR
ncbi:MAG TPA: cell division topological specificity factor MinE [Candidatus Dormibacteraeota bacterium]|nr:cell division topological specificity factor MinE [Candidatus Dormibacteraeota bacterium]